MPLRDFMEAVDHDPIIAWIIGSVDPLSVVSTTDRGADGVFVGSKSCLVDPGQACQLPAAMDVSQWGLDWLNPQGQKSPQKSKTASDNMFGPMFSIFTNQEESQTKRATRAVSLHPDTFEPIRDDEVESIADTERYFTFASPGWCVK
jgi:hypothetical protein